MSAGLHEHVEKGTATLMVVNEPFLMALVMGRDYEPQLQGTVASPSGSANRPNEKTSLVSSSFHHTPHPLPEDSSLFSVLCTRNGYCNCKEWFDANCSPGEGGLDEFAVLGLFESMQDCSSSEPWVHSGRSNPRPFLHHTLVLNLFDVFDVSSSGRWTFPSFFLVISMVAAYACCEGAEFMHMYGRDLFELIVSAQPLAAGLSAHQFQTVALLYSLSHHQSAKVLKQYDFSLADSISYQDFHSMLFVMIADVDEWRSRSRRKHTQLTSPLGSVCGPCCTIL